MLFTSCGVQPPRFENLGYPMSHSIIATQLPGFVCSADDVVAVIFHGDLRQALAAGGGIFAGDAGAAEFAGVQADRPGDGIDRQIAERIGAELGRHFGLDFRRDRLAVQEVRGEQFAHGGHVDAVKARRDDGRAGHADVDFLGPAQLPDPPQKHSQRRGADDRILDQDHSFAFQHFAQRRVFSLGLALPVAAAFDERPAAVAIADQAFHAGDFQAVGHGVGRRLARVGHGRPRRTQTAR